MEDDILQQYIPAYGDRVKAVAFCKTQTSSSPSPSQTAVVFGTDNSDLLQRLKDKYNRRTLQKDKQGVCNKNALKAKRRVELGWMDYDTNSRQYRQVRSKKGGGTRHLSVDRDLKMRDILETGKSLFFPDGVSPKGNVADFHIEIRDFRQQVTNQNEFYNETVEEAYEKTKLKILRLYLYSRPLVNEADGESKEKTKGACTTALEDTDNDSGDEFLDTDTPTIKFRKSRPKLSLRRTSDARGRGSVTPDTGSDARGRGSVTPDTGSDARGRDSVTPDTGSSSTSSHCLDFIEVVDSEDEELERAIQASIMEVENTQQTVSSEKMESGSSVGEILQKFGETAVNTNERTELIIFRKKILESAFLGMARPAFKLNAKIYIKFSGEIGQDYGGPRREFFRLAMKELAMSTMFEGKSGSRIFSHNIKLLEENKYCIAGRLVALSFAQEGPGPHFFNGTLYDLMTETKQEQGASIEKIQDVLPFNVQEILKQLLDMQSETDREKFLVDHGEWLTEQGIPNIWRLAIVKKMEMADLIIKQFVYYRTAAEISQFVNGMESVSNFWSLVKSNPAIFKALFCYTVEPLSKQQFESLCNVSYSEIGSNKRCLEDETIYCWEVFLQDISDGNIPVTFEELLAFITGADKVPPCGFSKAIDISFYPVEHGVYRLPHVSTCSLELHLPRGIDDIKAFQELMIRALKESMGFEKI